METRLSVCARSVVVRAPEGADGRLPLVALPMFSGDGAEVWARCQELGCPPFALVSIGDLDWGRDMTPWPAEAATRSEEAYGGEAGSFLAELVGEVLPAAEVELARIGVEVAWRGIAGYSLAGLFALWSCWQTGAFTRAASASGSLWYEGWLEYAAAHAPNPALEAAYLSLGSKEHRTPNRLMRHVRYATEETRRVLAERGVEAALEINPGNHFHEPDLRMARGIRAIVGASGDAGTEAPGAVALPDAPAGA